MRSDTALVTTTTNIMAKLSTASLAAKDRPPRRDMYDVVDTAESQESGKMI